MTSHPEYDETTTSETVAEAFSSSIKGKVILITGVNLGGLGGATSRVLAAHSPKLLICTGRSTIKVQQVLDTISSEHPDVRCVAVSCELSSIDAVRKAAEEINNLTDHIDILINNAGVLGIPNLEKSFDGHEMHFAINNLGHFLLTALLSPKIIAAAKTSAPGTVRIVNVASNRTRFGGFRASDIAWQKAHSDLPELDRPQTEAIKAMGFGTDGDLDRGYNTVAAYASSKTGNVLLSIALNSRLLEKYGIASFAPDPGAVPTEIARYVSPEAIAEAKRKAPQASFAKTKTLEQGAATFFVAALDTGLQVKGTDVFLGSCQLVEAEPWARSEEQAEKLWSLCEGLVNEKFDF